MPRKKTTNLDMLAAAFLASEGANQAEISRKIELSQAVVSRLLKRSRDEGYLVKELRFVERNQGELQQAQLRAHKHPLVTKLDRLFQHSKKFRAPLLRVFPDDVPGMSLEQRRLEFRRQAAPHLKTLILRAKTCGLTWGGMLWNILESLRTTENRTPWINHGHIEFVPLCGESHSKAPTHFSSSNLASEFSRLVNGDKSLALSLGMVPAYIPEKFPHDELAAIQAFVRDSRPYRQIFIDGQNGQQPLAYNLDMIVTSVGKRDRPFGFGEDTLIEYDTGSLRELSSLIAGDLGGVPLERSGLTKTESDKVKELTMRWQGLQLEHLESCSLRAHEQRDPLTGKPGIVVVSRGVARAPAIYEGVKKGLINHLLINEDLAAALEQLIERKRASSR